MSGPTGHEHEPDQAALDELERAFADEHDAEPADAPVGASEPSVPEFDERQDTDGGGPTQPVAPSVDEPGGDPTMEVAPADDADPPAGAAAVGPGELGDIGELDDPDDLEDPDDVSDDGLAQILIVEAEPIADPSAEPPKIIRIDDYSGSVATEDVAGDELHADGAATSSVDAGRPRDDRPSGDAEPIVIEVDDEEIPDAVYVEGSLDQSGSRSIVFIEDDDTGDTLAPEAERDIRRGIEPRMRERRVAVKRAKGRKRLKWVGLIGAVVVLVVGALAVLGSGWFAIQEDQVSITGNVYTDRELLQDVVEDLVGTPVLLADTQGAERELEQIPWVDTARVRTDFPHGVTIEIRERKAISTYRGPDLQFRVLDREGRVLDVIEKYPIAYVLLGGPDPVDLDAGEFAPRGYAAASELAKNLTGSVRGRVVRIEVTSDGSDLVMFLDDDVQVRFGEARDLFTKLVRLETVLSAGGAGESTVIDVSTNEVTL